MICNIQDPITHQDYSRDPRNIARKAYNYMKGTGIADECLFGPELEFFVFDDVRFDQRGHEAYHYSIPPKGRGIAAGRRIPTSATSRARGSGYFPCPPTDSLADLRTEMAQIMAECGIATSAHYHEVATGGQSEIDLPPRPLVESADHVMLAKYIIRNAAHRGGKTATFMPKPLFGDNGSGMHTHFSLSKEGESVLAGEGYGGLSEWGSSPSADHQACGRPLRLRKPHDQQLQAAGRGLRGANASRATVAGTGPRSSGSRSTAPQPLSRRIEYRCPDAAANPYLLFSAMLMAAVDGIQTKVRPENRSTRTSTTSSPKRWPESRSLPDRSKRARRAQARPRFPAPRRRLHARRHRHLDLVQARARSRAAARFAPILTSSHSITTSEARSEPAQPATLSDSAGSGRDRGFRRPAEGSAARLEAWSG